MVRQRGAVGTGQDCRKKIHLFSKSSGVIKAGRSSEPHSLHLSRGDDNTPFLPSEVEDEDWMLGPNQGILVCCF